MVTHAARLFLLVLIGLAWSPASTFAQAPGHVRIVFAKAALIAGAGAGRGVLTYRGRDYKFTVSGLSLGITAGASAGRLSGTVSGLREVSDFSGIYSGVGAGSALVAGGGGVQLGNPKGVRIVLQGTRAGMEFSANLSGVQISLSD
jgi:hypothetical protein